MTPGIHGPNSWSARTKRSGGALHVSLYYVVVTSYLHKYIVSSTASSLVISLFSVKGFHFGSNQSEFVFLDHQSQNEFLGVKMKTWLDNGVM